MHSHIVRNSINKFKKTISSKLEDRLHINDESPFDDDLKVSKIG